MPGIVALTGMTERLIEDHENARVLADRLAAIPGIDLDPSDVQTNIIIFGVSGNGMDAPKLTLSLEEEGVMAVPLDRTRIRLVTHYDVSREDCLRAADQIHQSLKNQK